MKKSTIFDIKFTLLLGVFFAGVVILDSETWMIYISFMSSLISYYIGKWAAKKQLD